MSDEQAKAELFHVWNESEVENMYEKPEYPNQVEAASPDAVAQWYADLHDDHVRDPHEELYCMMERVSDGQRWSFYITLHRVEYGVEEPPQLEERHV